MKIKKFKTADQCSSCQDVDCHTFQWTHSVVDQAKPENTKHYGVLTCHSCGARGFAYLTPEELNEIAKTADGKTEKEILGQSRMKS